MTFYGSFNKKVDILKLSNDIPTVYFDETCVVFKINNSTLTVSYDGTYYTNNLNPEIHNFIERLKLII